MASYDNEIERRLALEKGMPTAATIYEHELRRRNVENPIIKVDQEEVKTTFGMVVATLRSISENPNLKSAVIITQRYNIPRAEAFFDVCGWNQNRLIQEWIFNNYKIKTGENLLTDEYRKIVSDLHERGVEIKIIGAEDIMDQVDNNKIQSGAQPRYGAVLRLVYPPKLSRQQFESMNPEEQRNWIDCIKNLRVRLETEERGVRQIKNQTYWAP